MISVMDISLKEASRLSWGSQQELCMKDGDPLGIVWTRALLWVVVGARASVLWESD